MKSEPTLAVVLLIFLFIHSIKLTQSKHYLITNIQLISNYSDIHTKKIIKKTSEISTPFPLPTIQGLNSDLTQVAPDISLT